VDATFNLTDKMFFALLSAVFVLNGSKHIYAYVRLPLQTKK